MVFNAIVEEKKNRKYIYTLQGRSSFEVLADFLCILVVETSDLLVEDTVLLVDPRDIVLDFFALAGTGFAFTNPNKERESLVVVRENNWIFKRDTHCFSTSLTSRSTASLDGLSSTEP